MSIVSFLTAIRDGAPVTVPPDGPVDGQERAASEVLGTFDLLARTELAFDAPCFVPEVAWWAAERLYRACQFLVYREVEAEEVREGCAVPCPKAATANSADVCYSADVILRYLPDIFALARGIAREDPLIEGLLNLARRWPLSSVGMPDVGAVDVSAFIGHAGLRRLYADRIIERNDRSRLDGGIVDAAVREAIGGFPALAPSLCAAVAPVLEERND